jgi:hypothetical protein
MRSLILASSLAMGVAVPVVADEIVIHNGLAPPNPANVIDSDDSFSNDFVLVQNVGCDATVQDPCPMPWGDPTSVELVDGGSVFNLDAYESSTVTMSGGEVHGGLGARDVSHVELEGGSVAGHLTASGSASVSMSGGTLFGSLFASESAVASVAGGVVGSALATYGSAVVTVRGGAVGYLRADESSIIRVAGSGFAVNGIPVSEGPLQDSAGTLTGTLSSGESINTFFCHSGCSFSPHEQFTGLITLVPEPDAALLPVVALSLAWLRRLRAR